MLRLLLFVPLAPAGCITIPTKQIAPGVEMPVISIGDGGQESRSAEVITSMWLSLGGRGVDTAYLYRNQASVATAIKASGIARKDVFITTKIPGCSNAESYIQKDLQELGTDYIDLLLIHFPRGGDCAATWSTLEDYHAKGVLKAIGISQFTRNDINKLMKTAKVTPHLNQIPLNVLMHDSDQIAATEENKITVEAFSPLGRGGQSGDISDNKVIQRIAAAHSVSAYQIAMKWILQHGWTLTFQSSKASHQKEDADVFSFTLTAEEMSSLDKLQGNSTGVDLKVSALVATAFSDASRHAFPPASHALNLTMQADRQACLKAVHKYRPDIQLCADQYQKQADKEADYDNTHGAHAYLHAHGWSGTCSSPYTPQCVGQCECPKWGKEAWQACIDAYYKEGPGGGHYDIMMNKGAKCVSCGYGGGTMTHNFCNGDSLPRSRKAVVV